MHLTHLWNYHHFMRIWECTLAMCSFKLSYSVYNFHKTCTWMIDSHMNPSAWYFKLEEEISSWYRALLAHESYKFEITIILCASEYALWLCVSSNYLHQYMNFHKPHIWTISAGCLQVRGDIITLYEVNTSTSCTWKLGDPTREQKSVEQCKLNNFILPK